MSTPIYEIVTGDCLAVLQTFADETIQTCVTSPPYWGLRDYGVEGQIGNEKTPEEYVAKLVAVFREVRRVLRDDGTLWLNLGDTYTGYHGNSRVPDDEAPSNKAGYIENMRSTTVGVGGLKNKDLVGIPWMAAFALRADGWYLRQDIIWHKPNPMPESVTDRCTKAHEYLFMFSKSPRYYYDHKAILEPFADERMGADGGKKASQRNRGGRVDGLTKPSAIDPSKNGGKNKRSVWTVSPHPFRKAHFATYPPALVEPCILAGSRLDDVVLDPFNGAGTTGVVALQHGRNYVGIELNPEYVQMTVDRIEQERK